MTYMKMRESELLDKKTGLYICPTPIGNLADITIRVLETLKQVDIIAAEDTRHTRKLLSHYDIHTPMISYHKHNSAISNEKIMEYLSSGSCVALVSDAGTPIISDPGQSLIEQCVTRGYNVVSLPGATACITALVGSGLCAESFLFVGFLDRNKSKKKKSLDKLKNIEHTLIFYEAPHRLIKTLEAMYEVFGDRDIALARELTKKYEEYVRGSISDVIKGYGERAVKGEFVILVQGNLGNGDYELDLTDIDDNGNSLLDMSLEEHLMYYISQGMRKKEASLKVAKARGLDKREVYKISAEL